MKQYYYLTASVPTLVFGNPPPIRPEDFYFQSLGGLAEEDYLELRHVLDGRSEACYTPFAKAWFAFQDALAGEIAMVRARRLGVEPEAHGVPLRAYDPFVDQTVVDAFAKTNPREREEVIARARWFMLDILTEQDPFGFRSVLAIAIKLQIMDRWHRLRTETGAENVTAILQNLLEPKKEGAA